MQPAHGLQVQRSMAHQPVRKNVGHNVMTARRQMRVMRPEKLFLRKFSLVKLFRKINEVDLASREKRTQLGEKFNGVVLLHWWD